MLDFQNPNIQKLQIFWGFNYISSSFIYVASCGHFTPGHILSLILRAMMFKPLHQIFKISSSFNSSSMHLPRKAMHQLSLPSLCLPYHKQSLLLQQPTSSPRSLPHTPSLTSNNISSLKIYLLYYILPSPIHHYLSVQFEAVFASLRQEDRNLEFDR